MSNTISLIYHCRNWYLKGRLGRFNITIFIGPLTGTHRHLHIPRRFLSFRDRHSDDLARFTVSPELQDFLASLSGVIVTVVPDCYRPWTKESQSHLDLKATSPTFVTTNKLGEPLWTDINAHVVFHGNLHNPCKVVAIGHVKRSGRPGSQPEKISENHFSSPTGIAIVQHAGKEHAIVADSGNKALRMITNVASLKTKKVVYDLNLSNVKKGTFKPLAVAVKEECKVFVSSSLNQQICLFEVNPEKGDATCIMKINNQGIIAAGGLAYLSDTDELLVANDENLLLIHPRVSGSRRDEVLQITLSTATSFADVAVSESGKIGISDREEGCVRIYEKNGDLFELLDTLGDPDAEYSMDGASDIVLLEEPLGTTFPEDNTMYICCYRGGLKLYTGTSFAIDYCREVDKLYLAAGYEGRDGVLSFATKLEKIKETAAFMEEMNTYLQIRTGRKYITTEHGGVFPHTLACLKETCKSITLTVAVMEERGCDTKTLNFYSLCNESPVEHGFGLGVQQGQYHVLSHQQYAAQKVTSCDNLIRQCCKNKFSFPVRTRSQYKEPLSFNITAQEVFSTRRMIQPKKEKKDASFKELKKDLDELDLYSKQFRPQPRQAVRDKYKAKPGFAPSVTSFRRVIEDEPEKELASLFEVNIAGISTTDEPRSILETGDLVVVLAPDDSPDEWWLFQITRDHFKAGKWDPVYGRWLERESTDENGHQLFSPGATNNLQMINILKDDMECPFIIIEEYYDTVGAAGVVLNAEACSRLDELAELANRNDEEEPDEPDEPNELEEPEVDAESSDEEQQPEQELLGTRRHHLRGRFGQNFKSYKDMIKGN